MAGQENAVDVIDLGLDFNDGFQHAREQVDLGLDFNDGLEPDIQVESGVHQVPDGMPNLAKYIDIQETDDAPGFDIGPSTISDTDGTHVNKGDRYLTSSSDIQNSGESGYDTTDFTPAYPSDIPPQDSNTGGSDTEDEPSPLLADLMSAAVAELSPAYSSDIPPQDGNTGGSNAEPDNEPSPLLADLISAAVAESSIDKTETLDFSLDEGPSNTHQVESRPVPQDVQVKPTVLQPKVEAISYDDPKLEVHVIPNVEPQPEVMDNQNVDPQPEVKAILTSITSEVKNRLSPEGAEDEEKNITVDHTKDEFQVHAAAAADVPEGMDTREEAEGSMDVDLPAVTTIRQTKNEDDEEFDFEMPAQKILPHADAYKELFADIWKKLQELEMRIKLLTVYEEGRYSAEPLETLQPNVLATINNSQTCFSDLEGIQSLLDSNTPDLCLCGVSGCPKQHQNPEYKKIHISLSSAKGRLQNIQKLAHLKNAMVQERMKEEQANLEVLEQANESLESGSDALTGAAAEWDAVQTVTAELGDGEGTSKGRQVAGVSLINLTEAMEAAEAEFNLMQYKPIIKTSVPRKSFGGFMHKIFGSKLQKSLHDERNLVFCLAACPYTDQFPVQWRVLQTIYRRLTGAQLDCPRYGGHWEQIGFQGNDPATDLRGCGFLGLLQLLHMVCDPMIYPLAKEIYRLSLHETQHFPFSIMGINMTRIVIQSLREDNLNKECNKRKNVLNVVNELYVATWLQLYRTWKTQHKTIADTGYVMRDIENQAKKNPQGLISALNTYLAESRSKVAGPNEQPMTFIGVSDLGDGSS